MNRWKKEYDENGYEIRRTDAPADTKGKTENFATRNVRLITFLVCIGVFIAITGPLLFLGPSFEWSDFFKEEEPEVMTTDFVVAMSEYVGNIPAKAIKKYAKDVSTTDYGTIYYIDVAPHYMMLAVADARTEYLISCDLMNTETGASVDVINEDVKAFLEKN